MRKYIALVLVLVSVLGLVGCNQSRHKDNEIFDTDELQEKYSQFFNVSTYGGLKVYVWQMAENNYRCYLVNKEIDALTDQSFVFEVGTTIAEMRAILSTYDVEKEDIIIYPIVNLLSSYYYKIDNTYCKNIKELFWKD